MSLILSTARAAVHHADVIDLLDDLEPRSVDLLLTDPRDRDHVTQKPVKLMRQLVQAAPPDGTVLDPFGGSGSTAVAALLEGRRVIAADRDEGWARHIAERIESTRADVTGDGFQASLLAAP